MNSRGPEKEHRRAMRKKRMAPRVELVVMLVLLIIALAHLVRLVSGTELQVGATRIPMWVSLFGSAGPAVLAGLFWWSRH